MLYSTVSQKTADLVSVKVDEFKSGGKQSVRLETNWEKNLSISYEDYKKAVEEAERVRAQSAMEDIVEPAPTQELTGVDVRDADEDWIYGG